MELSEVQADGIESANLLTKRVIRREINQERNNNQPKSKCSFCGYQHVLGKNNCPAYGKKCRKCHKWNHFKACCNEKRGGSKRNEQLKFAKRNEQLKRSEQVKFPKGRSRRVNNLNEGNAESSSEDDYVFLTSTVSAMSYQKFPKFKVKVNGTSINVMADTGASVNILDEVTFGKLRTKAKLSRTKKKIFPFGSNKPLPLVGKCSCEVETEKKFSVETFFIVKGTSGCLVCWQTSQRLGLVQVAQSVKQQEPNKVESLVENYRDFFEGLGKLKGFQVRLHVDEDVLPVAQPPRRVPFHVRKKLEEQLLNDEKLGVIEKTEGSTPWVSPVVVVPKKDGKVRVCVDMRQVNKSIENDISPRLR